MPEYEKMRSILNSTKIPYAIASRLCKQLRKMVGKTSPFAVLVIITFNLIACGGGGGDSTPPPPPPPPQSACGPLPSSDTCKTLSVDTTDRHFQLYEPSSRQSLAPVVIFLHGAPGSPTTIATFLDSRNFADDNGYLAVMPIGRGAFAWTSSVDNNATLSEDTRFVEEIINDLVSNHRADPNRIHIAGFSAGGFMIYQLACEIPEKLHSVFAVSGQFRGNLEGCNASFPLSIHHVHGTNDTDVPDSGRADDIASVQETLELWIDFNSCNQTPSFSSQFVLTVDNKMATTASYQNCAAQGNLQYTEVETGVHEQGYDFTQLHQLMKTTFEQ